MLFQLPLASDLVDKHGVDIVLQPCSHDSSSVDVVFSGDDVTGMMSLMQQLKNDALEAFVRETADRRFDWWMEPMSLQEERLDGEQDKLDALERFLRGRLFPEQGNGTSGNSERKFGTERKLSMEGIEGNAGASSDADSASKWEEVLGILAHWVDTVRVRERPMTIRGERVTVDILGNRATLAVDGVVTDKVRLRAERISKTGE